MVFNDVEEALPLAACLMEGGLSCAEVTFRTVAAEGSIRRMVKAFPDMLVGAGTVLTCEQAQRAIDAGAKFIVSPGFNPKVTEYVLDKGVSMTPAFVRLPRLKRQCSLAWMYSSSSQQKLRAD